MSRYTDELTVRLTGLGATMANKQIIIQDSNQAETDGKIIHLPLIEKLETLFGLVGHESFHIRAKSFEPALMEVSKIISSKYKISQIESHTIVNITEDYRINEWLKRTYSGSYQMLIDADSEIVKNAFKQETKELPILGQIIVILSHLPESIKSIFKTSKLNELTNSDINKINKLGEEIINNISPEFGVIAAQKLAKIYSEILSRIPEKTGKNGEKKPGESGEKKPGESGSQKGSQSGSQKPGESGSQSGSQKGNSSNTNSVNQTKLINQKMMKTGNTGIDGIKDGKLTNKEKYQITKINKISQNYSISEEEIKKVLENAKKISEKEIEEIIQTTTKPDNSGAKTFTTSNKIICKRITDEHIIIKNAKSQYNSYKEIVQRNRVIIRKLSTILDLKAERIISSRGHTSGRMNRDFVRGVSSNYSYRNFYSKQDIKKSGRILYILDLSSSMNGNKIEILREAIFILIESLKNIADISIIGYASYSTHANIFVFKEFGEPMKYDKINAISTRTDGSGTPTGEAIESELKYAKKDILNSMLKTPVVLITDGKANNVVYTEKIIKKSKKTFNLYGIGISASSSSTVHHFKECFGDNFILVSDINTLKSELIRLSKIIVRNF